ncbi:hypothetical protein MMC07_009598 [Pseudocyphellaria aurata]|nr:hypothetical protein [Pseudocyphellaria aurata]
MADSRTKNSPNVPVEQQRIGSKAPLPPGRHPPKAISTAADGSPGPSTDTRISPYSHELRPTSTGYLPRTVPTAEQLDEVHYDTEAVSRPLDDGAPMVASQHGFNVGPVREEDRDRSDEAATARDSSSEAFCLELASRLPAELGQYRHHFICSLDYLNKVIVRAKQEYGEEEYMTSFFPVAYILRPWPRSCLALDIEREAFTKANVYMPEIAALLFPELAVREGQAPHAWAYQDRHMEQKQHGRMTADQDLISWYCGWGIINLLFSDWLWTIWFGHCADNVINVYQCSSLIQKTQSFTAENFMSHNFDSLTGEKIFVPYNLDWLVIGAMGFKLKIEPSFFVHYCSKLVSSVMFEDSVLYSPAIVSLGVAQRLGSCAKFVWDGHCPGLVGINSSLGTFRSVTSCYELDGGTNLLLSKGKWTYKRDRYPTEPQIKAHEVKTFLSNSNRIPSIPRWGTLENGPYDQLPSLFLVRSPLTFTKRGAASDDVFYPSDDASPTHSIVPHIHRLFSSANEYIPADAGARDGLAAIFTKFGFFLALSSWIDNLKCLDKEVAEVEQDDITDWTKKTFKRLHATRLKLAYARFEVHELQEKQSEITDSMKITFSALDRRERQIAERLNNLFQVFMGTTSLNEAHESVKLAERATFLGIITLIYLPLSLATGVFGMNTSEINGGHPKWWACVAMAGGLLVATVACMMYYRHLLRWVREVRGRIYSRREDTR